MSSVIRANSNTREKLINACTPSTARMSQPMSCSPISAVFQPSPSSHAMFPAPPLAPPDTPTPPS